jgi:hypothetical protein
MQATTTHAGVLKSDFKRSGPEILHQSFARGVASGSLFTAGSTCEEDLSNPVVELAGALGSYAMSKSAQKTKGCSDGGH